MAIFEKTARRDYYEVLGVARDADLKTIKDAFRQLALKNHPDRNKQLGAEARFKEIVEAYAFLSDPKKRVRYDACGFAAVDGLGEKELFASIDLGDILRRLNVDIGESRLFSAIFNRHWQRRGPPRGGNLETSLLVSLDRVMTGGEETVFLSRRVTCLACQGSGAKGVAAPRRCDACKGTGSLSHSERGTDPRIIVQRSVICPNCGGCGSLIDHPCPDCAGSGQVEQEETLTVTIPRGVEEGMALRIPGKGMTSPDADGGAGDAFVIVRTRRDPRFERSGENLLRREVLSVPDAVLGTTREIPTLEGSAMVSIPPGTQSGSIVRLEGKGLPELGSERCGELYLHIVVQVPEKLSREEKKLYERLREMAPSGGKKTAARWWQIPWRWGARGQA